MWHPQVQSSCTEGQGKSGACAICRLTTRERVFHACAKQCVRLRNWSNASTYYSEYTNTDRASAPDLGPPGAAADTKDPAGRSVLAHRHIQDSGADRVAGGRDHRRGHVCDDSELDGSGHQEIE